MDNFTPNSEKVQKAVDYLTTQITTFPPLAVVLGSGLGFFTEKMEVEKEISFKEIPYYPTPTIAGHGGQLVFGTINSSSLIAIKGRVHYYEGRTLDEVTFYVHLLHKLGVQKLILTNAAGSVRSDIHPRNFIILTDYINFTQLPLPPLKNHSPFSKKLINIALEIAQKEKFPAVQGIYAWTTGPSYETPAEVRAIRNLGASVVGMSTVPEAVTAASLGIEVLGVSLVTNYAAGVANSPITHDEVQETAEISKLQYSNFIASIIRAISNL